jgi:NAD(P)-dependent dehydrogenase (short-subunit alcohol dehydrogenase family)
MTASSGKVCFMTGATGGLGSELALSIAGQGYSIFFTWNASPQKAEKTLERIQRVSPASEMIRCDMAKPKEIQHAFAVFGEKFGRLDLLLASASNFYRTTLPDVSEADWDNLVDTNLKGTFFTMQEAIKIMRRQSFLSRIIAMTDVSADLVWKSFAPYTVSKAGIQHLIKIFAREFAPQVLVNGIAPGTITRHADWRHDEQTFEEQDLIAKIPLHRLGSPLDISRAVHFLLESDYITGQIISIDGGRVLG